MRLFISLGVEFRHGAIFTFRDTRLVLAHGDQTQLRDEE
jgi:hypothetical protein